MTIATRPLFISLIALSLLAGGCSDDSSPTTDAQVTPDLGRDSTVTPDLAVADGLTEDAHAADQAASDITQQPGAATNVELGLHDNAVKIKLATMEVLGKEATEWDLYMSHDDPVDQGPHLVLGPDVTAQNLGAAVEFHDLNAAPEDGYQADDPNAQTYVIGSSWRNGGSGTTGFLMTGNVYAITCATGHYAKIEVLSAQSGKINILSYYQGDGSTYLATLP